MALTNQDKTLIKKVLTFCGIMGIILFGANKFYYNNIAVSELPFTTDAAFYNHSSEIKYLFAGHSRGLKSIDTTEIPGAYNFCSAGEHISDVYYKLKYILKSTDKKIQYLVIPTDKGSISGFWPVTPKRDFWIKYYNYYEFGYEMNDLALYAGYDIKTRLFPYQRYIVNVLNWKFGSRTPPKKPLSELTEEEKIEDVENWMKRYIEIGNDEVDLYEKHHIEAAFGYLKRIVELCREHDIQLICLQYPVTQIYSETLNKKSEENNFDLQFIQDYLETQKDIVNLDMHNALMGQPQYFHDFHHLTPEGAKVFSRMLNDSLKQIEMWQGN